MVTTRDIMRTTDEHVGAHETLADAARKMRDLDVALLPVCGPQGSLAGMMTDRDIVTRCIAAGGDPYTVLVGELVDEMPVHISADASIEHALVTMASHRVRRLPVFDGGNWVGMLADTDAARSLKS
ncbi:MAG: CBS domain-containing protein [Nocardioidaceae bacterium]|jgi:CBS domain-containing protein